MNVCDRPSRSTYHDGCRCDGCRKANRDYITAWRRAAGVKPQRRGCGAPHGTHHRYSHGGCRCVDCTAANTEAQRQRRARLRAHADN